MSTPPAPFRPGQDPAPHQDPPLRVGPGSPQPVAAQPFYAPDGELLPLPHERDEAVGEAGHLHDPVIDQARRDLEAGLVDTDLRSAAGLDAPRRARLVGGPTTPHDLPSTPDPLTSRRPTMANVSEIMSTDVQVLQPQDSLQHAARLMSEFDVGSLPVCADDELIGMLTDRDITVRAVAQNLRPDQACVSDIMSAEVEFCTEDQDAEEVLRLMGDKQVRRLPVLGAQGKQLVGIVSLGDLALRQPAPVDQTIQEISAPSSGGGGADAA